MTTPNNISHLVLLWTDGKIHSIPEPLILTYFWLQHNCEYKFCNLYVTKET